jgi:putative transposase
LIIASLERSLSTTVQTLVCGPFLWCNGAMMRVVEAKLYPTAVQEAALETWLRRCCWLYNQALEYRIKAYQRRGETVGLVAQCAWLTGLRERMPALAEVPTKFARDALRRVDRGFQAFFRRCQAGEKPGFPRFRSHTRYNSLEFLAPGVYLRPGNLVHVPKLGLVKVRVGEQALAGTQKLLRLIRRASCWFAQVVVDDGQQPPPKIKIRSAVGIDVGLESFATLDTGEKIPNPRFFRKAQQKLKRLQRRVCRCQRRSRNRRRAARRLARQHERIAAQRRDFAHQQSRKLINRFDLIGFEKLNLGGLGRSRLAKSIHDAAWGMFLYFVTYKAEGAGRHAVPVNPSGTSQECPWCGRVQPKSLSERVHRCPCRGEVIDRDHASALVIRARALRVVGANACGGNGLYAGDSPGACRPGEAGSPHGSTDR